MRNVSTPGGGGQSFGLSGPVPRDIWILLGIVLGTFSLRFFAATAAIPALLQLTPSVWQRGFLWQLATYPFTGTGSPGFWFVLELLILFLFARTVFYQLGQKKFWQYLVAISVVAALVAVAVDLVGSLLPNGRPWPLPFALMQGQRMLLVVLIALFAVLNSRATILLFFVLPIQAKWFLLLEILFAFLGFLGTHDFPGFLGISAAVGAVVAWFQPGGINRYLREAWLRIQAMWFRFRLARAKEKRGLTVVPGGKRDDDWIH